MRRGVRGWNRTVAFVVGLVLLAGGVAAVLWQTGQLQKWFPRTDKDVDVARAAELPDQSWWPGISLAAGIILALLGLWWLLAHLRTTRITVVSLPAAGPGGAAKSSVGAQAGTDAATLVAGALTLNAQAALDHVTELVTALPHVAGATARLLQERHRPVLAAEVSIRSDAHLEELAAELTRLGREFAAVTAQPDLAVRMRLRVVRRAHGTGRDVA